MKDTIIVDIDVITEYLKSGKGVLPKAYEMYTMKVASSVYTELLASTTFKDEGLEKEVLEFLNKYFDVVDINDQIAIEAAKILRESDVTLSIALNAGTARALGLKLLANDKKPYEKISGLEFLSM